MSIAMGLSEVRRPLHYSSRELVYRSIVVELLPRCCNQYLTASLCLRWKTRTRSAFVPPSRENVVAVGFSPGVFRQSIKHISLQDHERLPKR